MLFHLGIYSTTQLYKNVNNKKLNKPGQFLTQCSFCVLVPLVYHHLIQCSTYAQFYPEIQKLINNITLNSIHSDSFFMQTRNPSEAVILIW